MTRPEYFITHFIDSDVPIGARLEKWPMHFTVIPPFVINEPSNEEAVVDLMAREGRAIGPIDLSADSSIGAGTLILVPGEIDRFGPEDKPEEMIEAVKLNDPTTKLHRLHRQLLKSLVTINCEYTNLNPEWSGRNYNPHVTLKSGRRLERPFVATTLSLSKKDSDGKSIVATVDMYNQIVL